MLYEIKPIATEADAAVFDPARGSGDIEANAVTNPPHVPGDAPARSALAGLPLLVSTNQVAELCGVSPRHICRLCEHGELKAVKLGKMWRINRDALAERLGL